MIYELLGKLSINYFVHIFLTIVNKLIMLIMEYLYSCQNSMPKKLKILCAYLANSVHHFCEF